MFFSYNDTLQVLGTCRSLSLSSDLKSLSVITEVRSADNNPEICYIQVRWFGLNFSVFLNLLFRHVLNSTLTCVSVPPRWWLEALCFRVNRLSVPLL